jgi:hypothetical protein
MQDIHMEYRRGPRFEVNQSVTVTNLEDKTPFAGRLSNFSMHGVCLEVDRQISPGSIVKVVWNGALLLGEVIYCQAEGEHFSLGLELEDALYDTEMLAAEMDARRTHQNRGRPT